MFKEFVYTLSGYASARQRRLYEQAIRELQRQQEIANSPVAREAYTGKVIEGTSNATQDR